MRYSLAVVGVLALLVGASSRSASGAPFGAAARTQRCEGVGGQLRNKFRTEWGAYKLWARNISCAAARRLVSQCWNTGKEPRSWTFLSMSPPGVRIDLVRGRQVVMMELAGGGSGCEGRGRPCFRERDLVDGGLVRGYARGVACSVARHVMELWGVAGSHRPKDRPGEGWMCRTRGAGNSSFHVDQVRCERRRTFVTWRYTR